jgi:hypothetical protein
LGRQADARNRTVRLRGIPDDAQEGLLQQMLEQRFKVQRLEIFFDKHEAIVELENAAVSGSATGKRHEADVSTIGCGTTPFKQRTSHI